MLGPNQKAILEGRKPEEVSRADWRAAKAADVLALREYRPARVQPRVFASPAHKIAAMAEVMALRTAAAGACLETDLRAAGFSASDVTLYAADAQVHAAAIMRDRVAA